MITGITAPADNRLQRTVVDNVRRHVSQRAAAEAGRYATLLPHARSVLAVALTALAAFAAAQEPICNPCVDGPEMFEHRRTQAARSSRADAVVEASRDPRSDALDLFDPCPADLQPIVRPSPEFPEDREWKLSVIAIFLVDRDGRVLTPRVRVVSWTLAGESGTMPMSFEKAIVDAMSKWRFPPRSKPCTGSIWRDFSHAF
jgi:hypothetical protein